jgi:hypothetical protein
MLGEEGNGCYRKIAKKVAPIHGNLAGEKRNFILVGIRHPSRSDKREKPPGVAPQY